MGENTVPFPKSTFELTKVNEKCVGDKKKKNKLRDKTNLTAIMT